MKPPGVTSAAQATICLSRPVKTGPQSAPCCDFNLRVAHPAAFQIRNNFGKVSSKMLTPPLPPLEAAPERRPASNRRSLHDHEAGVLKMANKPFRDDRRHELFAFLLAKG
jgi:hypothetical protein